MPTQDMVSGPQLHLQAQQKQNMTQRLMMSAHMQQALSLLQIPLMELEPFIEEQVANNPVLEVSEDSIPSAEDPLPEVTEQQAEKELTIQDGDFSILKQLEEDFREHFEQSEPVPIKRSSQEDQYKAYAESSICAKESLYEHLLHEVHESFNEREELEIAELLIGYIDEYGFLKTPLEEISALHQIEISALRKILKVVQGFEPYGIGASSIQEALLIQLRCLNKEHSLAYQIVELHYDEMLHHRLQQIQKSLNCSLIDIQKAIDEDIAKLDLHPGTHYSNKEVQSVVPDVTLRQEEDKLHVDINREYTPNLRFNRKYFKMLDDPEIPLETKQYIKRHVLSARWLMRNLQQRYSTIERIAASLARRQEAFFLQSDGKLLPLTMKMLAEELEVHESTIARTVANKYIDTPRGLMPLRAFFTTEYTSDDGEQLSSKTIQDAIAAIVAKEDKSHPLSDEKISDLLKERGFPCARRTVAKYRVLLKIGNTQQRRKYT